MKKHEDLSDADFNEKWLHTAATVPSNKKRKTDEEPKKKSGMAPEDLRELGDEELNVLYVAVVAEHRDRREAANARKKSELRVGDRVVLRNGVSGTVIKICPKNVMVQSNNQTKWRVSPSLLTKI